MKMISACLLGIACTWDGDKRYENEQALRLPPNRDSSSSLSRAIRWTAYTKIKHQRDSQYHRANLKNALNAVAGLFVMVLYLYKDRAEAGGLVPSPQLLRVPDRVFGGGVCQGYELGIQYRL